MRRSFNSEERATITTRDHGLCIYCGKPASSIDHVIPFKCGGITSTANGVCCCKHCNSVKHISLDEGWDEGWIVKGLSRLILHGEDISWMGVIKYEPVDPKHSHTINLLSENGYDVDEIANVLDLDTTIVEKVLGMKNGEK